MFLVRAEVCHERLWAEWFKDVVGLVPSPVAAAAACCSNGVHKAFDGKGDLSDQGASSTALPTALMKGHETSGFEGVLASQVCFSQHHRLPKQAMTCVYLSRNVPDRNRHVA